MKLSFLAETYGKNTQNQGATWREYYLIGQEINRSNTGDKF